MSCSRVPNDFHATHPPAGIAVLEISREVSTPVAAPERAGKQDTSCLSAAGDAGMSTPGWQRCWSVCYECGLAVNC